ncbi:MAG: SDR family NAD(P)-dependent oxidoreductase [Bacteroidia bacterium]|nr:SDR family NAD(P)-dependent oxidoreductase [Bacteroidia bacterium]
MNPFSLEEKTILVTGASSGIGRQAAITISEMGAKVIITGRNPERIDETFAKLTGTGHLKMICDLTDETQLNSMVDGLPILNGAVFAAGIGRHIPVKFIRQSDITSIFKTNYESVVLAVSRMLKKKKIADHSSLVLLSSTSSRLNHFGGALYSGTKAALEAYSKNLAIELAPKRIRSNCVLPWFVDTPMVEGVGNTITQEVLDRFREMSYLGFGDPVDVANSIVFFLSDASKWITGSSLVLGTVL